MAHFARIGLDNIVLDVVVVNNDVIKDSNGNEDENLGIEFLRGITGHYTWKQTSYTGSIRKNYAGVGYTYDSKLDAFYEPQPYPSWTLNTTTCLWEPPTPRPEGDGKIYKWEETSKSWIEVE